MPAFFPAAGGGTPSLALGDVDGALRVNITAPASIATLTIDISGITDEQDAQAHADGLTVATVKLTGNSSGGFTLELPASPVYDFTSAVFDADNLFFPGPIYPSIASGLAGLVFVGNNTTSSLTFAPGNTLLPSSLTVACTNHLALSVGSATDIQLPKSGAFVVNYNFSEAVSGYSAAEVNAFLALIVSIGGAINGGAIDFSGANAAPTGQGLTDKATLEGQGITVTTN